MPHFLNLKDIENICYEYAKAHLTYDEPIPSFGSRYAGKLEAILAMPEQTVGGKLAYPELYQQASILFYEMTKQHPFLNGNKRIACVSLLAFLALNNQWLKTTWKSLYDISVTVAGSKTENREGVLKLLNDFIVNNIAKIN